MSTSGLPDLASLQRELLSQWEKSVNDLLVKQMSTIEFGKQATQMFSAPPQLKKSADKLQDSLAATKGDVARLETRMKSIEDLLGRALAVLEGSGRKVDLPAAAPAAPRTKRFSPANKKAK
jgi:hypothetical protein